MLTQGVIDLIEAKGTGILCVCVKYPSSTRVARDWVFADVILRCHFVRRRDMLDETCRMPRATDTAFCEAVQDKHSRDAAFSMARAKRGKSTARSFR